MTRKKRKRQSIRRYAELSKPSSWLIIQEQIKKEQRIANATFGDRAQIDNTDADDDDDLFGDGKLNVEGKRLRKMMRDRGGGDDYDSSDSVCLPSPLESHG